MVSYFNRISIRGAVPHITLLETLCCCCSCPTGFETLTSRPALPLPKHLTQQLPLSLLLFQRDCLDLFFKAVAVAVTFELRGY